MIQPWGGWLPYYPQAIGSTVFNLWAWEDINNGKHLAVGSAGSSTTPSLSVIQDNGTGTLALQDISPHGYNLSTPMTSATITTTAGSPVVTVTIPNHGLTPFDTVNFLTHVSVDGLNLFGLYPVNTILNTNQFTIIATDVLNQPLAATSTVPLSVATTSATGNGSDATLTYAGSVNDFPVGTAIAVAGVVPAGYNTPTAAFVVTSGVGTVSYLNTTTGAQTTAGTISSTATLPFYTTQAGLASVEVTFPNHGYSVGSTFTALVPTTVGGVTISGEYQVTDVVDVNNFFIDVATLATANASGFANGGVLSVGVYVGQSPLPQPAGWGQGPYGGGGWGTGVGSGSGAPGTSIQATDWTLDNWGNILIACPYGGAIYQWDPTRTTLTLPVQASVISQAPQANAGVFVAMPQRQLIAWGSTDTGVLDPLLIRWCDVEDFTNWIARPTNQAGEYRIPTGSKIVGGAQMSQQGVLWTDLGVWAMQYTGQPFIYGFNEIGRGCGLISPKAFATLGTAVWWMSQSQFFTLGTGGVEPLPCTVWDIMFQQLDQTHLGAIRCGVNSYFNEVIWYFPTVGSNGINTNYVKYNWVLQAWDYGALSRTAWLNQSVLGPPIGAGGDQIIYQHETGTTANGQPMPSSFTTGYFALNEGDMMAFVDEMWPDMKWGFYNDNLQQAQVDVIFNLADYPGDQPTMYGPYSLNTQINYLTPRMRGRLMAITVQSAAANLAFWRLGNIRYRVMADGKY